MSALFLSFFCLSRQSSVRSVLLLIFIFPQDFNCFVPPLSCPAIVSAPSVCGSTAWLQGVVSSHSHAVFCCRTESMFHKNKMYIVHVPTCTASSYICIDSYLISLCRKSQCRCCSENQAHPTHFCIEFDFFSCFFAHHFFFFFPVEVIIYTKGKTQILWAFSPMWCTSFNLLFFLLYMCGKGNLQLYIWKTSPGLSKTI